MKINNIIRPLLLISLRRTSGGGLRGTIGIDSSAFHCVQSWLHCSRRCVGYGTAWRVGNGRSKNIFNG